MQLETGSLTEFFVEEVEKARKRQKVRLREGTQFYIVNLLSNFLRAEKLHQSSSPGETDEPLAITFSRAVTSASQNEQIQLFRSIGDRSLYMSGFFGDSFKRKVVDIDYYIAMGEKSYGSVSSLSRGATTFSDVFDELAEKFARLVNLISEISETAGITSDTDLLRLYERWLKTKGEHLSERLKEKGILPIAIPTEPIH